MAESFYKLSNSAFIIWAETMLATVENNIGATNIDSTLITEAKTIRVSLNTNLSEKQALEDNLAGKIQEIKFNRNLLNKLAAKIQALLKNDSDVSNSFIEQAGFNVNDGVKSVIVPLSPTNLVVTGTSDGINLLKWSKNGNKPGTLYIIEAKTGDDGEWIMIDVVKTLKFEHKNQIPGVKMQYRVKSKRNDTTSTASNVAVVYG